MPNANTPDRWLGGLGRTITALVMAPFVPQRIRPFVARVNQADLLALTDLIGSGKVTSVLDRTYPRSAGSPTPSAIWNSRFQGWAAQRLRVDRMASVRARIAVGMAGMGICA